MKKLLVVLLVLGFSAAPAAAAQWDFYGSLRTHLGYYDVDQEFTGGPGMDGTIGSSWDDDAGTLLSLGGNSRFGAKAMVSENFYGVIELGFRESTRETSNNEDTYLRMAYGVWNFGAGKLLVGKDYTPGTYLGYSRMGADIADQGDANMLAAGLPYIGRQPQVKLSFGDLDIAFIEQNKDANDFSDVADADVDMDFVLPRIEAAYVFRTDLVNIRPVLGYQSYELEFSDGGDEDIDSFLAGIGASFDLKPFYVKATASYIQNAANYGDSSVANVAFRGADLGIDDKIHDSDLYQGTLVAGMQVNKMLNIEAGFGYQQSEVDKGLMTTGIDDANGVIPAAYFMRDAEQSAFIYYLQAWISLSKNMHIIPEIGVVDRDKMEYTWEDWSAAAQAYAAGQGIDLPSGNAKDDMGKLTYFDINFRVDF